MSFKVKVQTHVVWPVKANIPQDGGRTTAHDFFVRFKRLSEDDFNAKSALSQTHLLKHVVLAVGETENDVEDVTPESLNALLAESNYRLALYEAYLRMDVGVAAKN